VLLANASMTAAVDRLAEKGWVERRLCESDRRTRIVALTAEGQVFIEALYARHACDIERVAGVLEPAEKDELRRLLKKLGMAAQTAVAERKSAE
jgi:MarR family 2-MHQ and catechol resistance regulon transcriptional repressor